MSGAFDVAMGIRAPEGVEPAVLVRCVQAAEVRPDGADVRHLERLARVARMELASRLTAGPGPTLQRIVEAAHSLLPDCGGVSVILHDEVDRTFQMSASTVPGQVQGESASRVRSKGATRFIVDAGRGLYVDDVENDPFGANRMLTETSNRSYVGLPLRLDNEAIGVLYAMAGEPRAFTPEDIELLRVVADRAAMVITAARDHARIRRVAMRSEALTLLTLQLATRDRSARALPNALRQLAMATDLDVLVVQPGPGAPIERIVVGDDPKLASSCEDPEEFEALRAVLAERSRAVAMLIEEGPLEGVVLHALKRRAPIDELDRSTLRHVSVVLGLPFR